MHHAPHHNHTSNQPVHLPQQHEVTDSFIMCTQPGPSGQQP